MITLREEDIGLVILKVLEDSFPDRLPYQDISSFELGRLIGQQDAINKIKEKIEIDNNKNKEIR